MLVAWYLRRGVPWTSLLGCSAAAAALAAALERWPASAMALLPVVVACCAAAAAFCFDEVSLPVVEVTPRGGLWSRSARLLPALLPLGVWSLVAIARPGDLPLARGPWLLVGLGLVGLAVGLAALASRRAIAGPGGSLAAAMVLAVISPVVICAFLGWDSIYPIRDFGADASLIWMVVAGVAALTCVTALRPGLRR